MAATPQLAPGQIIDDRYRIIERLAGGGMGVVYRAEHVELGKRSAIKVLHPELSQDAEFVSRFKREALASSRIGHQNIVEVSDFGRTAEGLFFFVMEFLEGKTLHQVTRSEGPIAPARVIAIGLQVARALAAAHKLGIVHRDLKPENVMLLQRSGTPDFVKVVDFGLAKDTSRSATTGMHTAIGVVVGTPQYMSPEQAAGLPVNEGTDIYSLGLILHELLCGRPTFEADTPPLLMAMHVNEQPTPLQIRGLPADVEALIQQMLAKRLFQRPRSMDEVVERLEHAKTALPRQEASGPEKTEQTPAYQPPSGGLALGDGPVPDTVLQEAPVFDTLVQPALVPPPPAAPPARDTEFELPLAVGKKRAWWPAALLLILAAGGAIALLGIPSAPKAPAPPPAIEPAGVEPSSAPVEPAAPVTLTFTSTPERAEVYEGEYLLGSTPFTISRPPGTDLTLRFALRGRAAVEKKLTFEKAQTVNVELLAEKKSRPRPKKKGGDLQDDPYR